jgi:hypothetical protein
VIVRLEDESAAPRLGEVAGVTRVEPLAGAFKLTLDPGATRSGALRALLDAGIGIESFSHAIMPIEDVFVKVVREGLGLDHGKSAAEAPVEEALS